MSKIRQLFQFRVIYWLPHWWGQHVSQHVSQHLLTWNTVFVLMKQVILYDSLGLKTFKKPIFLTCYHPHFVSLPGWPFVGSGSSKSSLFAGGSKRDFSFLGAVLYPKLARLFGFGRAADQLLFFYVRWSLRVWPNINRHSHKYHI